MKKYNGIVIAGPTGVGKTDLSIMLAKKINGEIISADASQVYKNLDIGTAKITKDEMDNICHYMLDIVSIGEDYSVGDYEREVNDLLKNKVRKNVLLVGGTGLYIRAITDGFSNLPEKDINIRKNLENKTLEELQLQLKELDIECYGEIDLQNKIRIIRAIEVCLITGEKFSYLKKQNIKSNDCKFLKIFLTRNREELYDRINKRVDIMIKNGLIEEAKNIYENYKDYLYKISAIGYKELFEYFDNKVSLEEAVDNIKRESRRYAKRQMTWFNGQKDYVIYNLSEKNQGEVMEDILNKFYGK